VDTDQSSL